MPVSETASGKCVKAGRKMQELFIEDQQEWSTISFGWHPKSNMAYSGCGIIAIWNVLVDAGRVNGKNTGYAWRRLTSYFERHGAVWGGRFGISVAALYLYLRRNFPKVSLTFRHNRFALNSFGLRHDVFVATLFNDKKHLLAGLHTVCITKSEKGFAVHNCYRKDAEGRWSASPYYSTLFEALAHVTVRPWVIVVIGIQTRICT